MKDLHRLKQRESEHLVPLFVYLSNADSTAKDVGEMCGINWVKHIYM